MKKSFFKGNRAGNFAYVRINTDQLEAIHSALFARYITRVGILGSKTSRKMVTVNRKGERVKGRVAAPQTNAEIGLVHEKGSLTRKIPRRSFLEMPLVLKAEGLLAIKSKVWGVFVSGDQTKERLKQAYTQLGMLAERIVQAAFETRGFGKWAPDSDKTIARKGSDMPLIDSAQLRRSITSDVVTK